MDTGQAEAQDIRPKQLFDLTEEIVDRICDYLAPAEFEPHPFKREEIHASFHNRKVQGWDHFTFDYGLEAATDQDYALIAHRFDEGRTFPVLQSSATSSNRRPNHLANFANFAATCKAASAAAQKLKLRRNFLLTVSNYGITFEGLRSGLPWQTFRVRHGCAMIDSKWLCLDPIGVGELPGNLAFDVFCKVLTEIRRLRIHITADLDWMESRKLRLFLQQINHTIYSVSDCRKQLPSIDLTLDAGFHWFFATVKLGSFITLSPKRFPDHFARHLLTLPLNQRNIASATLPGLLTALRTILQTLSRVRKIQTTIRDADRHPFAIKVLVHDGGLGKTLWGNVHSVDLPANASNIFSERSDKLAHETFEEFCRLLQEGVFESKPCSENKILDSEREVCQLGLPYSSEGAATKTVRGTARKRPYNEDGDDAEHQMGRSSQRPRVV